MLLAEVSSAIGLCFTGKVMKNLNRSLLLMAALPFMSLPLAASAFAQSSVTPAQSTAQPNPSQENWATARLVRVIREAQLIPGSPGLTAISSDNSKVASVIKGAPAANGGETYIVRVWDLNTGAMLYTVSGHTSFIGSIAFSPDGKTLATSDYDDRRHLLTIRLWDAATGQRQRSMFRGLAPRYYNNAYYFRSMLAFSPDSRTLYSSATTPDIQVWNVSQGGLVKTLVGHPETLRAMQISPDGRTLATTHVDGRLSLLDLQSGRVIRTFATSNTDAYEVAFGQNGQTVMGVFESVVRGDYRREIIAWDVNGQRVGSIDGFPDESWIVFSPDGKTFADIDYQRGIRLNDLATGAELRSLQAQSSNVAFSPDGQVFVAVGQQGIRVWR